MKGTRARRSFLLLAVLTVTACAFASTASAARIPTAPGTPPGGQFEGDAGSVVSLDTYEGPGNNNPQSGAHDNGRGGNTFVNDPCIDPPPFLPPPENRRRTVQSETDIATFGKYMVAGWNDSFGFYDNTQGLSGFGYSINGGNTWIDGGGLPPNVKGIAAGDRYFGDPVLVVDKQARTFTKDSNGNPLATPIQQPAGAFYYASLYDATAGTPGGGLPGAGTLSVNQGIFTDAPPTTPETASNTRCLNHPEEFGVPDTSNLPKERIVWAPPVIAVPLVGAAALDFLDKEWLHIDQRTGTLYLTYTRFGSDGSSPIELVRSFDGGRTWTPPTVIVANEAADFNQATYPVTVALPGGGTRVVVGWWARTFDLVTGAVTDRRVEYAVSNDNGNTFGPELLVQGVNRMGEPKGYNRGRTEILNAPALSARGSDVYLTYFNGKPGNPPLNGQTEGPRGSDIILASSHDGGLTFPAKTQVNDDDGLNTHVFPVVQVNKHGDVYVGWLDRRNDTANEFTDAWAAVSRDNGATFGHNKLQTDVATTWRVRADARPNFGDYNSSELLNDNQFLMIWADGRFPPPGSFVGNIPPGTPPPPVGPTATPDVIFTIANGLGSGNGSSR